MYFDPTLGHVIVKVVKDNEGNINAYKLENNDIVPKEQAIILAKQGTIKGVSKEVLEEGDDFLKSLQEDENSSGLGNLPSYEDAEGFNDRHTKH